MGSKMVSFNGGTITLGQIPSAIAKIEATKRSLLLQSAPGYGKSAKIYEYAKEKGYKMFVFTGGLISKSNIYGVDFIDSNTSSCKHYLAEWYTQAMEHKGKVILFLDDFGNANPQEMMILQQILGDRKLGNYDLPIDKFLIIGATNRQNDRANVYSISSAILSRCCVVQVRLDPEEFLNYAKVKFHPAVYSFLETRRFAISNDEEYLEENQVPADLSGFYSASFSSNSINPCPRTWEAVSDVLYEQQDNVLCEDSIEVFTNVVSGCVGKEITPIFIRSLKGTLNIPSIQTLVDNCNTKFNYADIITSDTEAVSCIAYTILQEINKRLVTYVEDKNNNSSLITATTSPNGRPIVIYKPLLELADVLEKLRQTKFKTINSNVIIADVWDLLVSNKTSDYYASLVETLFHLDYLRQYMLVKTNISNNLA